MAEKINQEVSVVMFYSVRQRMAIPRIISWQDHEYPVGDIGYHHTTKQGQTLHHIYEIVNKEKSMWFRLNLDTSNLHWKLESVSLAGLPER